MVLATVMVAMMERGKILTYKFTKVGDNLSFGTGEGRGWGDLSTYGYDAGAGDGTGSGYGDGDGEGCGSGYDDGSGWGNGRWKDADL